MKNAQKRGFTLVELIVVIAIMAILAAVLVPTITNKVNESKDSKNFSDCNTIASTISRYSLDKTDVTWTKTGCTLSDNTNVTWSDIAGCNFESTSDDHVYTYNDITLTFDGTSSNIVILSFVTKASNVKEKGQTYSVKVDLLANKVLQD